MDNIKRKNNIKKYLIFLIQALLAIFISMNIVNFIIPSPQFSIDSRDGIIRLYHYKNDETNILELKSDDGINYSGVVDSSFFGKEYKVNVVYEDYKLTAANVNGLDLKNSDIISFRDDGAGGYTPYDNITILKADKQYKAAERIIAALVLFIFWFLIFALICYQVKKSGKILYKYLIYSDSSILCIPKKFIILSFIVTCIFSVLVPGCDGPGLLGSLSNYQKGIDIYQLQAGANLIYKPDFVYWPYNYTMIMFYGLMSFINYIGIGMNFNIIQYLVLRLINMLLINMAVLAIISFLIDKSFIKKESASKIYLFSVFNPLVFYVAVIFLQFDMAPLYFIVLGLLLLTEFNKIPVLIALFTCFGVSMKSQNLILLPTSLVAIGFVILKEMVSKKIDYKKLISFSICFILFAVMFVLLPKALGNPIAETMSHVPQAGRIWFTVIQYAPGVVLYITMMMLVLFTLLNLFNFNLKLNVNRVLINCLLSFGFIIFVFSFSLLSTPSSLVHALPALVIIYALFCKDNLQRFIIFAFSSFVVFEVMFTAIGDITASLSYFNMTGIFIKIEQMLAGTDAGIKWGSSLFTISHTAMLTYAILFLKTAKQVLTENSAE